MDHDSRFSIEQVQEGDGGLYIAFPSSIPVTPGMEVQNTESGRCDRSFLIADILHLPDHPPGMLVARATPSNFHVGDTVVIKPGRLDDKSMLFQSSEPWFLPGRGIVLGGTACGSIAIGDRLLLRAESGEELACSCEGIEGYRREEYGAPTQQGEPVGILLSLPCKEEREALEAGDAENLLHKVGAFPTLHKPNVTDRTAG